MPTVCTVILFWLLSMNCVCVKHRPNKDAFRLHTNASTDLWMNRMKKVYSIFFLSFLVTGNTLNTVR